MAKRHGSKGFLEVDKGEVASGDGSEKWKSLNIETPIFLGSIPNVTDL